MHFLYICKVVIESKITFEVGHTLKLARKLQDAQAEKPTSWKADKLTGWQIDRMTRWQINDIARWPDDKVAWWYDNSCQKLAKVGKKWQKLA